MLLLVCLPVLVFRIVMRRFVDIVVRRNRVIAIIFIFIFILSCI